MKNDRPKTQTCFWQSHRKLLEDEEVHIHIDARCTLNPNKTRSKKHSTACHSQNIKYAEQRKNIENCRRKKTQIIIKKIHQNNT